MSQRLQSIDELIETAKAAKKAGLTLEQYKAQQAADFATTEKGIQRISYKITQAHEAGKKPDGSKDTAYPNSKASEGGQIAIYGLGRMPKLFYPSQFIAALEDAPNALQFYIANADAGAYKDNAPKEQIIERAKTLLAKLTA